MIFNLRIILFFFIHIVIFISSIIIIMKLAVFQELNRILKLIT